MRITTLCTVLVPLATLAQLPLPYTTGFDNTTQQQGWQEFRTGHLSKWTRTSGLVSLPLMRLIFQLRRSFVRRSAMAG